MFTYIKTHIVFHFSRKQFRLLLLLLALSCEYTFLVVPGTFANGVQQILALNTSTNSSNELLSKQLNSQGFKQPFLSNSRFNTSTSSRTNSDLPISPQSDIIISNADGWLTQNTGKWITLSQQSPQKKNITGKKTGKTAEIVPDSFNSAPNTPNIVNTQYPSSLMTDSDYSLVNSFPSGNPGRNIQSTTDVLEGTNLYFTDLRAQNSLSGTILGLSGVLATKLGFSSLSATGGILYDSGSGLFSDIFAFNNGLTRIGNTISITSVTGSQLSGFTPGQLAFGSFSGGLMQSSNLYWDDVNGKFGIGTSTPSAQLEIAYNPTLASSLMLGLGNGAPKLNFGWADNNLYHNIRSSGGANDGIIMLLKGGQSYWNLGQSDYRLGIGGAERLRVNSLGNVGIGTTNPTSTLSLANTGGQLFSATSNGILRSYLDANGSQVWYLNGGSSEVGRIAYSTPSNTPGIVFFNTGSTGRSQMRQLSSLGGLAFGATTLGTQPADQMVLDTNGNVGIGTATPGAKLDISAGAGLSGLRLSGLNGVGTALMGGTATGSVTRALGVGTNGDVFITNAIGSLDSRAVDYKPHDRPAGLYMDFRQNTTNGLNDGGTYNGVMTMRAYGFGSDFTGGRPMQMSYTENGNLWTRMGSGTTGWGSWSKILNDTTGWSTLGNTGTTAVNFIGTLDDKVLTFRTNNIARMSLLGGASGSGGVLSLLAPTSNMILWSGAGVAAPSINTRSIGTKLVLFPLVASGSNNVDYAMGIESSNLWFSVPTTSVGFKWYGGTGTVMQLINNQLQMSMTGARLSISASESLASIGRAIQSTNTLDIFRTPTDAGMNHRYGISNYLNRTENIDLISNTTINTRGLENALLYTQSALHQTGTIDVRGANYTTTINTTRSGATVNGYGIVNSVLATNDFSNLVGYSSTVYTGNNTGTNLGSLYGMTLSTYHNGNGHVPLQYGINVRSYNNSNTGTIGSLYGMNIDNSITAGRGAVGSNYGLNVAVSNSTGTLRAINFSSSMSNSINIPSYIDGVYGGSVYNGTGTASYVRGFYALTSLGNSTGSINYSRGIEVDARDGKLGTHGVIGIARLSNTQTGTMLAGGSFSTDLLSSAVRKYVTSAYGVAASINNAIGSSGTIVNQYGGSFSANANASSTNAYGVAISAQGTSQNNFGVYINSLNATATGSEGLTNNWGIYINNATKNFFKGNSGFGTATPGNIVEIYGSGASTSGLRFSRLNSMNTTVAGSGKYLTVNGSGDVILVNTQNFRGITSNNPERGVWNPDWNALASNKALLPDEDFTYSTNQFGIYNNAAGSTGVTIVREIGITGTPNSSKNRLKISYDGIGSTSPGLGGFYTTFVPEYNKTYVQRFRALIPIGYSLVLAENAQGTNNTSYWITDTQGTGKWEDYIRVSHAGNTGTLSNGGHIYLSGAMGIPVNWYIASLNVYEMNASQYAGNNAWQGVQTFGTGTNFVGGVWTASGSVGIGTTTPATKLQVLGDIRVGTTGTNGCIQGFGGATIAGTCSSDERLKMNILGIGNVLEKFLGVDVVKYNWNQTAEQTYHNDTSATQIGYLAQNIESLFPELVSTNTEGYKQVNYSAMNVYMAQAVKELALGYNTLNSKTNTLSGLLSTHELTLSGIQLSLDTLSQKTNVTQTIVQNTYIVQTGSTDTEGATTVNNYYNSGLATVGSGTQSMEVLDAIQNEEIEVNILDYIAKQLDELFDVLREIIVLKISAVRGYFHEIFVDNLTAKDIKTQKLCISNSAGEETCLTKEQLDALILNASSPINNTSAGLTETPVTETPVTETPVTETPVTETPVTETPVTETP